MHPLLEMSKMQIELKDTEATFIIEFIHSFPVKLVRQTFKGDLISLKISCFSTMDAKLEHTKDLAFCTLQCPKPKKSHFEFQRELNTYLIFFRKLKIWLLVFNIFDKCLDLRYCE